MTRKLSEVILISGGARGADKLGEKWFMDAWLRELKRTGQNVNRFKCMEVYHPNYEKYGKKAPLLRNTEMAENADGLVAFWDGQSTGTLDMIKKARFFGLRLKIMMF